MTTRVHALNKFLSWLSYVALAAVLATGAMYVCTLWAWELQDEKLTMLMSLMDLGCVFLILRVLFLLVRIDFLPVPRLLRRNNNRNTARYHPLLIINNNSQTLNDAERRYQRVYRSTERHIWFLLSLIAIETGIEFYYNQRQYIMSEFDKIQTIYSKTDMETFIALKQNQDGFFFGLSNENARWLLAAMAARVAQLIGTSLLAACFDWVQLDAEQERLRILHEEQLVREEEMEAQLQSVHKSASVV